MAAHAHVQVDDERELRHGIRLALACMGGPSGETP
jgi:hypothetical protein